MNTPSKQNLIPAYRLQSMWWEEELVYTHVLISAVVHSVCVYVCMLILKVCNISGTYLNFSVTTHYTPHLLFSQFYMYIHAHTPQEPILTLGLHVT